MIEKVEATVGDRDRVALRDLQGVRQLPSVSGKRRIEGARVYGWLKDRPEPAEFVALKNAALERRGLDATDEILGDLRVWVTAWTVRFDVQRESYEGSVEFIGEKQ